MKRIYLLMLLATITAANVLAQRNVDLSIRHFYKLGTATPTISNEIVNGTHILFDGDQVNKINFGYIIKNSATDPKDSVMVSDTIRFRTYLNGNPFINFADNGFYIPAGMQTTIFTLSSYPKAHVPGAAFNGVSQALSTTLCDSIWIKPTPGNMNPPVESNPANDTTCHNVIIDGWITGINDIDVDLEGNGLLVYPNPAVSRDINIMYNFGLNTSSAVVTIMDLAGKVVYSKNIGTNLSGVQSISLQMGNIIPGMYSVRLATDDKVTIEKIYVK